MSARLPHDPFNRTRVPVQALDRRGRVALLKQAAQALLAGEPVPRQAALYLGGAISAWLAEGGRLTRDFLQVEACRGSHHTVQVIAADLEQDEG